MLLAPYDSAFFFSRSEASSSFAQIPFGRLQNLDRCQVMYATADFAYFLHPMTQHSSSAEAKLHLAIIPDGNRRWARTKGLLPWNGHEKAVNNFRGILDWCREDGRIGTLTIWGFSTENWKRDPDEIAKLMDLFEKFLKKEREGFAEHKVRFVHSGRRDRVPPSLGALFKELEAETAQNMGFTMHLAIDYGGRDEVVRAVRRMDDMGDATEDLIRAHLDHPEIPDIDLIIRTSGEQRTSNFFLWQSCYAEWFFLPKHFPELASKDLDACLGEFTKRDRRFGGG
jgi:undecaprenyl diphosphate synthase